MHIISIFRKGRRKNSFKLYIAFRRVYFLDSFLLQASGILWVWLKAILLSSVQSFCSTLYPEFGYSFNTSRHELKILFPISSDEKILLVLKASANHLAPSSSTSSGHATHSGYYNDLYPLLCPTNLGLWSADSLTCIQQSVAGLVSSNTEGERKLNLTSPLSVVYHVTICISYELWTLGHSIVLEWLSPFSGQWLVAGPVNGYISVCIHWLA